MASRYVLLDRVGKGGMAELYRARVTGEAGFSKIVAVKRILPRLAQNELFVTMLIDEARLAAQLNHPNIVQVFELGRDESGLFIAMEFVTGPNLGAVLGRLLERRQRLHEALALEVTIQLLTALDYAHRRSDEQGRPLNLVHRDVSPENLLLTADGVVKLLDFGVAKAKNRLQETQPGGLKGKLAYMSPEQVKGGEVDLRTDIFAAGLVLWESLAGRFFYDAGDDFELMRQVHQARPRTLASVGVAVAPEVEAALARALAADREARFQTAGEFAQALMRFHRQAYPSYTPDQLGKLVSELFAGELAALAESLRKFESGEQGPSQVVQAGSQALIPTRAGLGAAEESLGQSNESSTRRKLRPATSGTGAKLRPSGVNPRPATKTQARLTASREASPPDEPAQSEDRALTPVESAAPAAAAAEPVEQSPKGGKLVLLLPVAFAVAGALFVGAPYLMHGEGAGSEPPVEIPEAKPLPRPPQKPEVAEAPRTPPEPAQPEPPKVDPKPKPQPKALAVAGKGTLELTCKPRCEVEVDGKWEAGVAGIHRLELAAGKRTLKLIDALGNHTRKLSVAVPAGKTIARTVDMDTGAGATP